MPVIEVGRRPELLRVMLVPNNSFFCEIALVREGDQYDAAPVLVFPISAEVEIRWPAELQSATVAQFQATAAEVETLIAASPHREAIIEYGGATWFKGKFEVVGPR